MRMDTNEDCATEVALKNSVVLRQIFSFLELNNLKQCRLVNKLWNVQAGNYMREFHKCHVTISDVDSDYEEEDVPCATLDHLLSDMTSEPIISSLEIYLVFHPYCEQKRRRPKSYYDGLLKRLPLKYLDISWDCDGDWDFHRRCPAVKFVRALLGNLSDLHSLKIDIRQRMYKRYLPFKGWTPALPKLKVLKVRLDLMWAQEKQYILKVINGAPNLEKLKGTFDDMNTMDLMELPKAACALVNKFCISICCEVDERICLKLAEARPALSNIHASSPCQRSFMSTYMHVLEKLLKSSCKTLKEFLMGGRLIPLGFIGVPTFSYLETLRISASRDKSDELLDLLKSINYPALLPSLITVVISLKRDREEGANLMENHGTPQFCPSTTAKSLYLTADLNVLKLQDLSRIFPKLRYISIDAWPLEGTAALVPYGDLWASCPDIESIDVDEGEYAKKRNFDAEFLGINAEEAEILATFDDKSLEEMNIVPIRPSILTMTRLKVLKIAFEWDGEVGHVPPDQIFLSKVTGILGFKKMTARGIQVQLVGKERDMAGLNHLRLYASFRINN